ncbi:SAV_2336 N-terminal domain-related protein [Streptomyces sp. NPDC093085]|uniref:SAV_2336 N-terminal domain-related protein n=1 Tax=Streptomyces sp. NPDC093085 TaxID=3155068 RepID=UPI003427D707
MTTSDASGSSGSSGAGTGGAEGHPEAFPELDALRELLTAAGTEPPTGRELAELLWLAAQTHPEAAPPAPVPESPRGAPSGVAPAGPLARHPGHPGERRSFPWHPRKGKGPRTVPPVVLRSPAPASGYPLPGSAAVPPPPAEPAPERPPEVLAPAPPMLSRPLTLQRALRPLRRTVPSVRERELDEAGTAYRIASLGAHRDQWLPELRPTRERWLHLRLVVDEGPTMAMWQPLAHELFTAFGQTGAFRTVEVVPLGADGIVPPRPWTAGRTLTLVVSDAMGPQWREGPAGRCWYRTLRGWARRMPVAVLQPLPERMWQQTALAPVPGLFTTPGPGAPNTALRFAPYDGPAYGIPVPVLEPAAPWLTHWADLVAARGGGPVPGAAALLPPGDAYALPDGGVDDDADTSEASDASHGLLPGQVSATDLVLRFRSAASPQAARLAGHLAVGPAHLPVMRLVQAAVEEHPQPQHLAEVVLSGMLRSVPGPPGSYDFRPGVREVLLNTLPRTSLARTVGLLDRVGAEIESRAGAARGEFRALLDDGAGGGAGGGVGGGAGGEPFALVSRESLRLLRGPEVPERETGPVSPPPMPQTAPQTKAAPTPVPTPAPTPVPTPTPPGRKVVAGRYELLEVVGRGGSSTVWRAYDRTERRSVAVKWMRGPGVEVDAVSTRARSRFLHTMRVVAELRHPNIIEIHHFGTDDDGASYVVMELVTGRTLDAPAADPDDHGHRARLSVAEIAVIARQVIAALTYAHDQGVWHRHLSPASILLRVDGVVKVGGFGLTRTGLDSTRTSQAVRRPTAVGTPQYMSPEQIAGGEVDQRSDLYSLGCVLYELATGEPPFAYPDIWQTLTAHRHERPRPPGELRADLPAALEDAILDLLAKNPEERWRGADSLASEILPESTWQYGVLGRLRATHGGRDRTPRTPAGRVVLSRLLLSGGTTVSVRDLRLALSGDPSVRTDVLVTAGIDELLASGHNIVEAEGGYRLRHFSELDLITVEELARTAANTRDLRKLAVLYQAALDYWRGEPLANVEGAWAERQREELSAWKRSLEAARDIARDGAAAPLPSPGNAVRSPGNAVRLTIGGAELYSVPPRGRPAAQAVFLPLLRQACREAFGSSGTFVGLGDRPHQPTMTFRVTADPAYTVPEVLNRLAGPFAEALTAGMSSLFFPLTVLLTVLVDVGEPEEAARAVEGRFPAPVEVGGSRPGKISMMVGMRDEVYRQSGVPGDFVRRDTEGPDGIARPVWYLTLGYPPEPQAPKASWFRRLLGGGGGGDTNPPGTTPPSGGPR